MTDKPRKLWLAGLLTVFTIGLGHVYAGKLKKGIVLCLAQAGIVATSLSLFMLMPSLTAIVLAVGCGLFYFLYCFLDAIKTARKGQSSYQLQKYNRWYVYLAFWAIGAIAIQPIAEASIKSNVVQAYKLPSGAMIPSLLIGDQIIVDKTIYSKSEPQRGDIVVFPFPQDPQRDFIKRVIGLGGDVIEIREKQLFINNEAYDEAYVAHLDPNMMPGTPRDSFGPTTVPQGFVFVMGDNRDNSLDSRFWGFVDERSVSGKAKNIYWSWDSENNSVRWDRIGMEIQ